MTAVLGFRQVVRSNRVALLHKGIAETRPPLPKQQKEGDSYMGEFLHVVNACHEWLFEGGKKKSSLTISRQEGSSFLFDCSCRTLSHAVPNEGLASHGNRRALPKRNNFRVYFELGGVEEGGLEWNNFPSFERTKMNKELMMNT